MGHTYSKILVHAVFGTKDRRPMIRDAVRQRLYEYMAGVARQEFGKAEKIGGTDDHLHGLLELRTDVSLAEAMRKWKSLSSGWLHKAVDGMRDFAWQTGYSAFSVSPSNRRQVSDYVDGQAEHHKKRTFTEELVALLERHGIDFDPQHLIE